MKIKEEFLNIDVYDETILIAVGREAERFHKAIVFSKVGGYLIRRMKENEYTAEEIVELVTMKYNVDEERARRDVQAFLNKLEEFKVFV